MAMAADSMAMDSNSAGSRKFKICGVDVEFPYKPYGPQLAYMGKVLAALEQSRLKRNGSVNALLESPTGSGKTLALLCATLAWQHQFESMPALPAAVVTDPLVGGGGFIIEDSNLGRDKERGNTSALEQLIRGKSGKQAPNKRKVPTIFYATRTHTQITQVVREFRKTKYRVPMAVLAARKHYCTNKHVVKKKNIDEDCKILLKDEGSCCPQFKNVMKLKTHSSLQKGGSNDVHDIEDLVSLGHKVKGCAYFAARAMATEADIVFCPYSYILDPIIRRAMEVNLQGAIVVLDEAHNIEDVAREAGSIDLETGLLEDLRMELEQLSVSEETTDMYSPLLEMVQAILDWIYQQAMSLSKLDFEHYASSWRGEKAVQELRAAGISLESFQVLMDCSNKAVGAFSNPDETVNHLSGRAALALEGLFSALNFMLSCNGRRAGDYQLVIKKYVKRDDGLAVTGWVTTVSLWCLNPGVVFEEVASASRSIILTSGTLSPMDSFASELGVPFEIQMEAPHVVDMDKQVWAAALSTGPDNVSLNASYKNADGYAFQDAMGTVLEEVCKIVPDGALIFFPSYKLMDKLCARWKSTGQWGRLSDEKQLFVEPRGNNDQFEQVLKDYYNAVNSVKLPPDKKFKINGVKKQGPKSRFTPVIKGRNVSGAAFLAVCRGKLAGRNFKQSLTFQQYPQVSEGIDFSDKNARIVVIIGIPFPNVKDIQVTLKKQYNQENRVLKNLLSGDQWYCQQTFRALNQAVGRCIRHRYDYGAILLLDDRFKKPANIEYMSKWLRKSIRHCSSFKQSLEGLQTFYKSFEASPYHLKAPKLLPTVKSTLISTHKAKLLITPKTEPDTSHIEGNVSKLETMKVTKDSQPNTVQNLNSSSKRRQSTKGSDVVKKPRILFSERISEQFSPSQQKDVGLQKSMREELDTVQPSDTGIAVHDLASDMPEEADSDYEVFKLREDHVLWGEDRTLNDEEVKNEEDEYPMPQVEHLQLTQSPAVADHIEESSSRMNRKDVITSFAHAQSLRRVRPAIISPGCQDLDCMEGSEQYCCKHSDINGMDEVPPLTTDHILQKRINNQERSTLQEQPLLNAYSRQPSLWPDNSCSPVFKGTGNNVLGCLNGLPQPQHLAAVQGLTDCIDSERKDSCKALTRMEKPFSYVSKQRRDRFEELLIHRPQGQENEHPKDEFKLRRCELTKMHSASILLDLDTDHVLSSNSLSSMGSPEPQMSVITDKSLRTENYKDPNEGLDLRSCNPAVMHRTDGVPALGKDSFHKEICSSEQLLHMSSPLAPQQVKVERNETNVLDGKHEQRCLEPPGIDCTDRLEVGWDAACSYINPECSEMVISCANCSCLLSAPTKMSHRTLCKSYLVNLFASASNVPIEESLPVIIFEFEFLYSLIKVRLNTSKVSPSLASCDFTRDSSRCGVWVKEDGCVYEQIYCPRCEDQSNCVGVHIAATDKANLSLMDTVVFLEKFVKVTSSAVTEQQKSERTEEEHKSQVTSVPTQAALTQSDQLASQRAPAITPAKAKLKLQRTKL